MINNKDTVISVLKDCIDFNGEKLYPPFNIDTIKSILGEGRYHLHNAKYNVQFQIWDELGVLGWLNNECTEIDCWAVCFSEHEDNEPENVYKGKFLIGNKDYKEYDWKFNSYESTLKKGCFKFSTLMPEMMSQVEDDDKHLAERLSTRVEFYYEEPKTKKVKKPKKYAIQKLEEPILEFANFNFKLAVIQELMYEKKLLTPAFDIYEFAEEYTRREIDIDDEGYEPIKEAKKWFKDLQIPKSMASEITELDMDGGNDIYLEIAPFWDGEDSIFDVNKLTEEEVMQFPNLKHITLMSSKPKNVVAILEKCGVEVELL